MKRALIIVVIAVVLAPVFITATSTAQSAQTPTPTATPEPTPTPTPTPEPTPTLNRSSVDNAGPHSIQTLRENGEQANVENVESLRPLGDPPRGFVASRYRSRTLFDAIGGSEGSWEQIQPDSVVQQDEIELYGSAFGDIAGEYTVVVVYWMPETVRQNGTAFEYASNQTVDRHTFDMSEENLYSYQEINLRHQVERTWHVTMWLERDGSKVDGMQWTFQHRSNPESSAISINSLAGLWGYGIRNILAPGMASLVIGLGLSRVTIRRTARGPGYGVVLWGFAVLLVGTIVAAAMYYQIAVVLSNVPVVMGLSIGVIAYVAGLTFHEPVQRIGFLRRELNEVTRIPGGSPVHRANKAHADGGETAEDALSSLFDGDGGAEVFSELAEAIWVDLPEVPAVRTPDGYRVPVTGVRPFFARLFADAALLDMKGMATRQRVNIGRLDDIIMVDPHVTPAIKHKAATMKRVLPIDTMGDTPGLWTEVIAWILSLAILLGPLTAGYLMFDSFWNIGTIGAFVGMVATLIIMYSAEDGDIDFVPADPHYARAEDNLTALQRAFKESKEDMTGREEARAERATTATEAREDKMAENRTVTDRVLDALGAGDNDFDRDDDPDESDEPDDPAEDVDEE